MGCGGTCGVCDGGVDTPKQCLAIEAQERVKKGKPLGGQRRQPRQRHTGGSGRDSEGTFLRKVLLFAGCHFLGCLFV